MQKKYSAKYSPLIICMILAGLFLIVGCMELYGRIKYNPDVIKLYTNRSGLPDYNYYYTGRPNLPDAVIGIDKKYKFNDRLWGKIENHREVYKKIYNLNDTPYGDSDLIGSDIIDNNGLKLGIWFSSYYQTIVKKNPDSTVEVYTPYEPDDYEPDFLSK